MSMEPHPQRIGIGLNRTETYAVRKTTFGNQVHLKSFQLPAVKEQTISFLQVEANICRELSLVLLKNLTKDCLLCLIIF